jgi:glycosyltransferase involved in cell wall biosynthesis
MKQDKVRVAMDIGFATEWYLSGRNKVGIIRVIESLIEYLHRRPNVEVTLTGLCGNEPLYYSYLTQLFPQDEMGVQLPTRATVRSRFGLTGVYDRLMPSYLQGISRERRGEGAQTFAVRAAVKALKKLDVTPDPPTKSDFDVFLSSYLPLPPPEQTGGLPRVLWVYDLICVRHPEWVEPMQTAITRDTMASVNPERDWIVCNAEYVKQDICDYMPIAPERVCVVPLAASANFYPERGPEALKAMREKYKIPTGNYLLAVAAFQPRKNALLTVKAFVSLIAEHPEITASLVLAGKLGQSKDELMGLIGGRAREFQDRIHLAGYIADEDLSALYSGARAFVFPSLAEGFGLPPLEAMRCGTPVIVANTTSLPEVVGDAGLQVDPLDEAAIAGAMQRLLTDDALHTELSRKGEERARDYTWERCAELLEDVLRRAAAQS